MSAILMALLAKMSPDNNNRIASSVIRRYYMFDAWDTNKIKRSRLMLQKSPSESYTGQIVLLKLTPKKITKINWSASVWMQWIGPYIPYHIYKCQYLCLRVACGQSFGQMAKKNSLILFIMSLWHFHIITTGCDVSLTFFSLLWFISLDAFSA